MQRPPKPLPESRTKSHAHLVKTSRQIRNAAQESVSASEAKTHLLELLDNVSRTREGLVITKRGRPVAKLVPIDIKPARSIFGCMKGTFRITGDIVAPEPETWEAML